MKLTYMSQLHGTRLSFAGSSKPFAQGVRAWRQRPIGTPVPVRILADHSSVDNCTRVSEVEHRHT
jgi:hypothetical protein